MITHKGTKTLKPERLTLRRFTPDDAQAMFENWASDARVTRYLTWQPHTSPEATAQLLALWCAAYENPSTYNWVLEYAGAPIGNISAVHLSERDEAAELGYCMGYAYWGKGHLSTKLDKRFKKHVTKNRTRHSVCGRLDRLRRKLVQDVCNP